MMAAAIWWRPLGSAVVRKMELGRALVDLQELATDRVEVVEETLGGRVSTTRMLSRQRIRVTSRPWTGYELWAEATAMVERLRIGGRITLAEDDATCWAAYVLDWTDPSTIVVHSSPWAAYGGTPAVGQDWRAISASPRLLREGGKIAVGSALNFSSTAFRAGGAIVTAAPAANDWSAQPWSLVTHLGFWPALRMPIDQRDQVGIIHRHRRTFQLDLTLEVDMHALGAISLTPSQMINGTTDEGYPTMDDLVP